MPYANPEDRRAYDRSRDNATRSRERRRAWMKAGRCYKCGDKASPERKSCEGCRATERVKRCGRNQCGVHHG